MPRRSDTLECRSWSEAGHCVMSEVLKWEGEKCYMFLEICVSFKLNLLSELKTQIRV